MLKRLLMFLLVIGLAAPAVSMPLCHAPAMPQAAHEIGMDHHGGMQHRKAPEAPAAPAATHDCIGCIATFADAEAGEAPLAPPALRLVPAVSRFPSLPDSEPASPPPRA